ncbi:MAG: hypothetical protein AAF711_03650 [Planctomycetota bacterium]
MTEPDLTPARFIERVKTQAAARLWTLGLLTCVLIALVPIAVESTRPVDMHGQLTKERIFQAQSRIESGMAQIEIKAGILKQRKRELQAEQHLTKRPDWSVVLALVAGQFNEQLMMTGCQLGEAKDTRVRSSLGPIRDDVANNSVWMILTGVAEANSNVPGLIMRLESLGLFERVVMTGSQRESFAGGSRTTFTLACRISREGSE